MIYTMMMIIMRKTAMRMIPMVMMTMIASRCSDM